MLLLIILALFLFPIYPITRSDDTYGGNKIDGKNKRLTEYESWKNDHMSWLSQSQASELDAMFKDGASNEDLFLKIFEYFDSDESRKDSSSQIAAIEHLSRECTRFIKENAQLDSAGFFDTLEEMFAYPFDEDIRIQMITKANQLYSKVEDGKFKAFTDKLVSSCARVFILHAYRQVNFDTNDSDQQAIPIRYIKGFSKNYDKWINLYLSWLTEEQKNGLQELRANHAATLDDFHVAVLQAYGRTEGETLLRANQNLILACDAFIAYLDKASPLKHLNQFQTIRKVATDVHTVAEGKIFTEKIGQLLKNEINSLIAATSKNPLNQMLGSKYLPTCHDIYMFSCRLIRTYYDYQSEKSSIIQDEDIEEWMKSYFNWLTREQELQLRRLKEDGASIDELHFAIESYYGVADGAGFIKATQSLYDGCVALINYVAGEDSLKDFTLFMENAVERYFLKAGKYNDQKDDAMQLNEFEKDVARGAYEHIIANTRDSFRLNLAKKMISSCSYIFETAVRVKRSSERYTDNHQEK